MRGYIALSLVASMWLASSFVMADEKPADPPVDPNGPRVEVSPKEFDFGEVWEGKQAKQQFTVKNVGRQPLTLKVKTSCGCTPATQPKTPLAPGETSTFTLEYRTSRTGPTRKTAWLETNDPLNPKITIPVRGIVKPVFKLDPARRMHFRGLELTTERSETMRLENAYGHPVTLKLKEGQDFGVFDVKLRTVKDGWHYDLTVTTKPPLKLGSNTSKVVLATDLKDLPELTIRLFADARPLVYPQPRIMQILKGTKPGAARYVDIWHRRKMTVKVLVVKSDMEGVTWEIVEAPKPLPGSMDDRIRIRLSLPGYEDLPEGGGLLKIHTSAKDPQYAVLEVPVRGILPRPKPQLPSSRRPRGAPERGGTSAGE